MIREIAKELLSYSRETLGPDLRAVTRYNRDEHEPIYTREDVPEQIELDEDARSMFRHPLVRMQSAAQELSQYHPYLDELDASIYSYGTVTVVQFPITDEDGIIVTLECEGDLSDGFVSRCKSIVSGAD
ncbi:DUF7522 family protein [Natronoglomus mannanivorans]|uniref:Uncharacterized protein n=1 Tax=Natronoglomus mannanivorans TaxID=2979990 RepID=A0AAP2YWD6_9EURY|nr:hypothetical protein [Halobacteria archaeon AArc-xg1-1]